MSKELNVLQIIDSLAVGGAEVMAVNIANGLADTNVSSHICVTRKEGLLKEKINTSVGYLFLNKKKAIDVKAILNLKTYIKTHQINHIHAHSSSFFIAILVKFLIPSLKVIWHDHYGKSNEIEERKTLALKLGSFFFTSVVVVNQILYQWAEKNLKTKSIYYLANFSVLNKSELITKLKGIEGKRIVCLAAFRPQKDHLNLLKAFKNIQQKDPDWTLHLVGDHQKDDYFNKVFNSIKENNLNTTVYIYNACLDVPNVLKQATIGILSSNSEGLPLALLEYGLAKLPVVVTDVGDCSKVVMTGKSGTVIKKENSLELEIALEELINSEEKRKTYGELHYKNVINYYSQESFINQLVKIYTL